MRRLLTTIATGLMMAITAKADNYFTASLTAEEQALYDQGATIESFNPGEHSRHFIVHISATRKGKTGKAAELANPEPVLCFVFGMEDAEPAREEGHSMAEFHYTPAQAEQFLFAEGWDKYHDRFFTRAYVQEGMDGYRAARKK
jgi:hypothetical protein